MLFKLGFKKQAAEVFFLPNTINVDNLLIIYKPLIVKPQLKYLTWVDVIFVMV